MLRLSLFWMFAHTASLLECPWQYWNLFHTPAERTVLLIQWTLGITSLYSQGLWSLAHRQRSINIIQRKKGRFNRKIFSYSPIFFSKSSGGVSKNIKISCHGWHLERACCLPDTLWRSFNHPKFHWCQFGGEEICVRMIKSCGQNYTCNITGHKPRCDKVLSHTLVCEWPYSVTLF